MPVSALKLAVPRPCPEPWQTMTPDQQGRFCAHCQKTVVDFTTMTDTQVLGLLSASGGSGCGRFRAGQLNRLLTDPIAAKAGRWQWMSLLLSGWLSTQVAQAQSAPNNRSSGTILPALTIPAIPSRTDTNTTRSITLVIDGRVIDSKTRQSVPGATVVVRETNFGATTDSIGAFRLTFPEYTPNCTVWVFVSAVGYSTVQHQVQVGQAQLFEISEDGGLLDEVISTGGYVMEKPSRWRRIRNWFRH